MQIAMNSDKYKFAMLKNFRFSLQAGKKLIKGWNV